MFSDRRAKLEQLNSFFQCHFQLGGWRRKPWVIRLEPYCHDNSKISSDGDSLNFAVTSVPQSWSISHTIPDPWISLSSLFGDGWLRPAHAHMWLPALVGSSPAWPWVPSAPCADFSGIGGPHRRVLDPLQDQTLIIESHKREVQENCFLSNFTLLKSGWLSTACL